LLLVSWWPGDEDRELFTMMADEAIPWSWVQHPNVLRHRGSRSTEKDVFFYREHVPSWAFSPVIRGALRLGLVVPPGVASAIIADVLLGVHAIHTCKAPSGEALGMVHRTINPLHVLIGLDGVARLQVPDLDALDTRTGCRGPAAVIRTRVSHLAPEQIRGQPADPRTDIYACALLLWELLAGRRGFLAESDLGQLNKIIAGDIAPPSTLRPGLGPEVDAVVMRGLTLRPEDRFPDAPRMLEALLAALPPASPGEVAAWIGSLGVAPWWPHSWHS
jgi:eukaryotic-like serine/threonine-protein kinase